MQIAHKKAKSMEAQTTGFKRITVNITDTHTTGQPLKSCVHVYNWSSVCEGIIAYMVVMHKIRLCVRESVCMCLFVSMFTFVCNLMFHLH